MLQSTLLRFCIRTAAGLMLGVLLGLPPGVSADTFRWRDAQGNPAFGDTPPAGVAAERIDVQPVPASANPAEAAATGQRLNQAANRLAAEREARESRTRGASAAAAREAEDRRRRCEDAKWAYAALTADRPVYRDGEGRYRIKRQPRFGDVYEGPREYLDDTARQAEMARQQAIISSACEVPMTGAERERVEEDILHAETCERAAADLAAQGTRPDPERQRMLEHFLREECPR
jgi:hypothetical protein